MSVNPGLYSSDKEDWGTPQPLFDRLHREFAFDLDAAASAANAKCARYFTREIDALRQDWWPYETVYLNPPYGSAIAAFVRKAYEEAQRGCTVVCLLPSRTDTRWFLTCMKAREIRFIRGRLRFEGASNSAPFPSMIVVFGPRNEPLRVTTMEARE